ncbi:MAG TPA: hypothetical protein VMU63_09615 [Acidimicrobiales bacterium]|nr:hypothetical protein [Acidimicrobiales bacterium]
MSSNPGGDLPRLLTIMGSGETSPTMVKTHRALLERLGPPPVPAVLMDTPFGFQENAADITEKAVAYFAESVGATIEVAGFRSAAETSDAVTYEKMLGRLRRARYVFAGPGSPSYALTQWKDSAVPGILADKLERGGAVTFASAAALTLGVVTVPVYEIYKVGAEPRWLDGLDLLQTTGLSAAVIPHYNNAEGGNHDTRFCYLGERRLRRLEDELPSEAFVLGVDEHTGLVFDLDTGAAEVVGLGVVTVRSKGRSAEILSGETVTIDQIGSMARQLANSTEDHGAAGSGRGQGAFGAGSSTTPAESADRAGAVGPGAGGTARGPRSPLLEAIEGRQAAFDAAVADRDGPGAVAAALGLDDDLVAWAADTLQSDERDRGRAALRSMIVSLGDLAETGLQDPRRVVAPLVELVLGRRRLAREERRFAEADALRDELVGLGIEIQDTAEGTGWDLRSGAGQSD